jgi:hypothetical protein
MKNSYIIYIFIFFLSSCISTNQAFFSDPNYLSSNEFSTVETINNSYPEEIINNEDSIEGNENEAEYYATDNYYDFSYASRIRRFHRPMIHNYGYYSGFYTDYYWYNTDPFYWGSSIYSGYGWYSPYYSFSPYYNYYSPFYYNYNYWNHHGYHGHFYNNHHYNNYTSYNNLNSGNHTYGPRGSLTSNNRNLIKTNIKSRNTWVPGTNKNIPNRNYTTKKPLVDKTTKSNNLNNTIKNILRNPKQENSYTKDNKSKERTYKSRNNTKSNSRSNFKSSGAGSRSSGNRGRSPKQRK